MRWRCAFGLHDWRILDVEPWGAWNWHTWKVRRECRVCGRYDDYHETNERTVEATRTLVETEDD